MLETFLKCISLVDRATVWQSAAIAALVVVTAVLEAFGIALIFAFVNALVDPSRLQEIEWIRHLLGLEATKFADPLLMLLAIYLLATFIVKNVILLVIYYVQSVFLSTNEALLATRLLDCYLNGVYSLHLLRNSSEFIRNLTGSVTTVFSSVFAGFMNLASEIIVLTALATVLLAVEPFLTLGAAIILGATVAIFFAFSKRHFETWGEREQNATGRILQSLQQGFHNIKEVKVLGRQDFILASFKRPRHELAGVQILLRMMTSAPRLWIESVIVVSVLVTVIFILSKSGDSANILAVLSLYAAAAFRMIPSMNRIIIGLNGIKNGTPAVNLIHDDFHAFRGNPDEGKGDHVQVLPFNDMLSLEGVSFRYSQSNGDVLIGIDLVLHKGESLGLVGPSGSGKTTIVDIVLGLLVPTSGRVTVDGTDISDAMRAWRSQIGYVPQSIYIIDDALRRNIAFGLADDEINATRVQKAIQLAQLEDLVRELPDGLDTRLGEHGIRLSGGQRQRVGIARALYRDPEVLILDEATSFLDPETEHEINNTIERLTGQKTLIIIAHRLSTVRKCSRLAFIKEGRLVDTGNFDELAARNADFSRMVELSQL